MRRRSREEYEGGRENKKVEEKRGRWRKKYKEGE
jgi:hypothetical protein